MKNNNNAIAINVVRVDEVYNIIGLQKEKTTNLRLP